MTLDDFFTLTEMNNGLTVPSRVMELVAVMQKARNCTVNVGDSTRQWSAVASAIAATENKDCLDLFIQLDGVHFIDKWLKDAQKFSNDKNDSFTEETITHLLQALEKLHANYEKLVASEIWASVEDLLVHNSSKVQDKARVLFENWKRKRDGNAPLLDVEKVGASTDDEMGKSEHIQRGSGRSESSLRDSSLSKDSSNEEIGQELTRDDPVPSTSSGALHSGQVEVARSMDTIIDLPVGDDRPLDHISSPLSKPVMEPPICQSIDTTLVESYIPAVSRQDMHDSFTKFHELESTGDIKHIPRTEHLPEKLGSLEKSKMSEDGPFSSTSDAADASKSVREHNAPKNSVAGDKNSCGEGSSFIDSSTIDSDVNDAMDGSSCEIKCRNSSAFKEGVEINHRVLRNASSSVKSRENPKDLGAFPSEIEDDGKMKKLDLHLGDDLANDYYIAQKEMDRGPNRTSKKSDIESDYGIVDPLEVARQVAIEVEREVVDYREQSCSSSEKLPEGNIGQPDSSDSVSGKQFHASQGSPKEVANDPELCTEASPMQVESATGTENPVAEQIKGTQDMETSQVTEVVQEEANEEKNPCNFDLNLKVCSEDTDSPGSQFLTPVSIVSASRAAAAPGLPVSPLQFEGNLGWKGSAATSAFRPASPRRMPESDKNLSIVGSSSSSKQPQGFLEIDLNVAESGDGNIGNLSLHKQVPVSSSIPSGESSVETNSKRSERLDLDLNLASEDGVVPSNWRIGQLFPQGHDHQSQSHSSSSSKQPYLRNIDLNDQPTFLNYSSDNSYLSKLSQNFNVSGGIKSDDSVISIMGTRVEVNRKDFVSQTIPLPNGRTPELTFDVNLGRTGSFLGIGSVVPYAHSSVYGYNNIAPGPAMPFSSIYGSGGPIPYMVDSRGAPVVPQIIGSASSLPTALSQPPIVLNMTSSTPSNGVGPSQSSFNINSGTMVEGGSRVPPGFRQFLNSGPVRSMDDQMRSNTLPTVSSVGGKRKEPENDWEHYPFRHYTPPWK